MAGQNLSSNQEELLALLCRAESASPDEDFYLPIQSDEWQEKYTLEHPGLSDGRVEIVWIDLLALAQAHLIYPPPPAEYPSGNYFRVTPPGRAYIEARPDAQRVQSGPRSNEVREPQTAMENQAEWFRRRQDATLPKSGLSELLKIDDQQRDFVQSQGLMPTPAGSPKGQRQVHSRPSRARIGYSESTQVSDPQVPLSRDSSSPPPVPRVFIGSSSEGLRIAKAIQTNLANSDIDIESILWSQGVFSLSQGTLSELIRTASTVDFAVLVLTPDDVVDKRGQTRASPRDNVLFELGLFMGKLGPERTAMVTRQGVDLQLPSDLDGITRGRYREHSDGNLRAALGAFCNQFEDIVREHRVRPDRS